MGVFDGHEAPTSLGSIYGYRYWNLVDGRLVSASTSTAAGRIPWLDGENVAFCTRRDVRDEVNDLLPAKPEEPDKPQILTPHHYAVQAGFFGDYVERARMKSGGGYSFPTTESGDVIIPQYIPREDYTRRVNEARAFYEGQLADYHRDLAEWEKLRDAALAEHKVKHQVPMLGCTCGFYMVKNPDVAKQHIPYNSRSGGSTMPLIFGVTEGYGKVVVGEKGWRFEKARIRAIVMNLPFMKARVELTLDTRAARVELKSLVTNAWNDFSEHYREIEFYETEKELRAEWDERVEAS
jgi:hypothetical protein